VVVTELNPPYNSWAKTSGHFTAAAIQHVNIFPYNWWVYPTLSDPSYNTEAEAKQQALANVDSTPYEFFEDVLELKETLRFLRNPLQGISDLARLYKRKKSQLIKTTKDKKLLAKKLSNLWNQYQFAFAPLVRSLMDGYELMEKWDDIERPARRSAHGRSDDSEFGTYYSSSSYGFDTKLYFFRKRTIEVEHHAAILYEVSNPLVDWKFKMGLRAKDIPSVTWQIMPLSFMVDRLYDINAFIKGLVNLADPRVAILAASVTKRRTDTCNVQCSNATNSYNQWSFSITEKDSIDHIDFSYDRVVWAPSISDTVPVFDPRGLVNSVTKIADLTSLILSRVL
jgi:hypothetical protein